MVAIHKSAVQLHRDDEQDFASEQAPVRLVVLDFIDTYLNSTIDIYGAVGAGWIMGPEYDYPVYFQEQPGKYRIEKLRDEVAYLGGTFFLKPDLDERREPNPLYWSEAGVAVPVAFNPEDADDIAHILNSISLAVEQSGFFTVGSVEGIRTPKKRVKTISERGQKEIHRIKWRGKFRDGKIYEPTYER
jgi:hypothetical protein